MTLGIIGLGRLGGSLFRALESAGHTVRTGAAACEADVVFLCVPDDFIATVAEQHADTINPHAIVTHCSGALGSDHLGALRERGCAVASFHPLQTFPDPETGARRFVECPVFLEGDERALNALEAVARTLEAIPQRISIERKTLYHAAAAMACNQVCALLDTAFEVAQSAGVEDPRAYLPLVRATLENIEAQGTHAALTGPVMRGDTETVARHLDALGPGEAGEIYRLLSRRALAMSDMPEARRAAMAKVLDAPEV